ncbi:MAG: mandelate racemase/muconate lactonizing enzyme family protein [Salinirussus sp.]
MEITDGRVTKLSIPERYVSDSQVAALDRHVGGRDREVEELEHVYLELDTDADERGIGFAVVNMETPGTLSPEMLHRRFEAVLDEYVGESPFAMVNGLSRHRGGQINYYAGSSYGTGLRRALDFALWDLCGKHLDTPVYELLGGDDPAVPVYASGLAFPASESELRDLYGDFADLGIEAAKVKVGFPTVEADIERLSLVRDAMGGDPTLLVDANEAWTPKETIRRVRAFRDSGFDIHWVEDPVLRYDVDGMRTIREALLSTNLCIGDYLGLEEKAAVLEAGACDVLNVHGFTPAWRDAHLAVAHGTTVGVGTDHTADIAPMHVGAALPEVEFMEFTGHRFWHLCDGPFEIADGEAIAPDRPGHGVVVPDDVIEEFGRGGSEL